MTAHFWALFVELIRTPFQHLDLAWGIVPLYFGWLLNEATSSKATYRTALQTGFSFVWAGAHWVYLQRSRVLPGEAGGWQVWMSVNGIVIVLVLALGAAALYCGLCRRFPKYGSFLGHSRFANYFMIAIYPMQAGALVWTWDRLAAVALFAVPLWLLLHFGLMPVRNAR